MNSFYTLLQADPVTAASTLLSFGPWAFFTGLCATVIIYLEKKNTARDGEVRKELADLVQRFDKYQTEDRAKMLDIIQQNTEVMQHNTDVMDEVVNHLKRKSH